MYELYNWDNAIIPNTGKAKRGFILKTKLSIEGMFDILKFEA